VEQLIWFFSQLSRTYKSQLDGKLRDLSRFISSSLCACLFEPSGD
jgi:hypothetical protein